MAELRKSLLYRGTSLEEDCKKFVEAIDKSVAAKFVYPKKTEEKQFVEVETEVYKKHFDIFVRHVTGKRAASSDRVREERAKEKAGKNVSYKVEEELNDKEKLDEELNSNTTFGRFYKYCLKELRAGANSNSGLGYDENYSVILYLYQHGCIKYE